MLCGVRRDLDLKPSLSIITTGIKWHKDKILRFNAVLNEVCVRVTIVVETRDIRW